MSKIETIGPKFTHYSVVRRIAFADGSVVNLELGLFDDLNAARKFSRERDAGLSAIGDSKIEGADMGGGETMRVRQLIGDIGIAGITHLISGVVAQTVSRIALADGPLPRLIQ